jgi:hypothetical protein
LPQAVWYEPGRQGCGLLCGIVARLGLGGRDVTDRLEEAAIVEPVHPFEGGELDALKTTPRAAAADDLGLEQTDDALGQRIVVAGHLQKPELSVCVIVARCMVAGRAAG